MYIARILYPVKVLGPGNRIAIWFSGCVHNCIGCSNPELWEQKNNHKISLSGLRTIIESIAQNYQIDGFTLTGGDPFFQLNALEELLPYLSAINEDILVYTGYEYKNILKKCPNILKHIAVIIDGKYIEEKNFGAILRGSDNQQIIYLKDFIEPKYREYLIQKHSEIQNFTTVDGIISVGIHLPKYKEELSAMVLKKGLKEKENGRFYT